MCWTKAGDALLFCAGEQARRGGGGGGVMRAWSWWWWWWLWRRRKWMDGGPSEGPPVLPIAVADVIYLDTLHFLSSVQKEQKRPPNCNLAAAPFGFLFAFVVCCLALGWGFSLCAKALHLVGGTTPFPSPTFPPFSSHAPGAQVRPCGGCEWAREGQSTWGPGPASCLSPPKAPAGRGPHTHTGL